MLDFITAPVEDQLIEFHERKVQKMLVELEGDEKLKAANRSKSFRMSIPRGMLDGSLSEKSLMSPLPGDGQPIPYGDLIGRSQYQADAAAEALQQKRWKDLKSLAESIQETSQRFEVATKVPENDQAELGNWAEKLAAEARNLASSADDEKIGRSEVALGQIQDLLDDKGMVTTYVRIKEPLVFSALLSRAIGTTQGHYTLSTLSIMEAFMAYFKVALMCGLVLGSPWIFIQLWAFIAAGLYPHEKRLVNVYLPFSLTLFLIGVLACQFFVIPRAVGALLWFNEWVNLEPELRFNEWLSFAIMMPLVFGISFQLPLVMMFLERVGILTVQAYLSYWKIAFLVIHVIAAVLMPSPDIVSMELLAIPLLGLYGLGILLCKLNPKVTESEEETSESEQMVEV
jgi:Tat protein translocase TatC